jgi:tRNA(Arg) A34 adenosine deaminase TadA
MNDEQWIRKAFEVARRARDKGNFPYGSILVDAQGKVLLETENNEVTKNDCTGHSEINLIREAWGRFGPEVLANSTLYSNCEPCAMCAGSVYLGNVGRLVYGISLKRLYERFGDDPSKPALLLPCHDVFPRGQRRLEIVGPLLEEEAWESVK